MCCLNARILSKPRRLCMNCLPIFKKLLTRAQLGAKMGERIFVDLNRMQSCNMASIGHFPACQLFAKGDEMLFLKSTSVTKAPGIYEVDVAAKPPGKTYGVYMAIDPNNPPQAVLDQLATIGFVSQFDKNYTHKDRGKVRDIHFMKKGSDLFDGWKDKEREENMQQITALFSSIGIAITPRVMTLAEAYA